MGVDATPANNTPVSLQPCGVSTKTVWITDQSNPGQLFTHLINGATDTSFANPYSLTDLKPGGDRQLFTWPLQPGGILNNKFANQVWSATFGVLPSN